MRAAVAASLVLVLSGCGSGAFFFVSNPQPPNSALTVSGFVTTVNVSLLSTPGNTSIFVTIVTLQSVGGNLSTFNFCGDVHGQFTPGLLTTVKFTQGVNCSNLVVIKLGG